MTAKSTKSRTQFPFEEMIQFVNARKLWEFLGVETRFESWINDRITNYQFVKGEDYIILMAVHQTPVEEIVERIYLITPKMLMELALVENTPKGREFRRIFIEQFTLPKRKKRTSRPGDRSVG